MTTGSYEKASGSGTLREKSDIKSGTSREEIVKINGGMPDKKSIEEINKANDPTGHKRAPGSVRV